MDDAWRGGRNESRECEDGEEGNVFRSSKKTMRSLDISGGRKDGMAMTLSELMKEEFKILKEEIKEEVREGIERSGDMLRKEMEELRGEMRRREQKWIEERGVMEEGMKALEERVKQLEVRGVSEKVMEEKVRAVERRLEVKEREERRRNVVMKEVTVKGGKRREAVKEIFDSIDAKMKIKQVRRLKGNMERGREMLWVRLESEGQRKEVMEKKRNLRGKKGIIEDLIWEEKRMKWELEEIASEKKKRGNKI